MLKSASLCLLLSLVFVACKKSNDAPSFNIEGYWEGKLGTGNATPNNYFGIKIKPGAVLERYNGNGTLSATGTWQLNGNTLTGTYTFTSGTIVTLTASVDKGQNKLSGTWKNSGEEEGLWNATKKN